MPTFHLYNDIQYIFLIMKSLVIRLNKISLLYVRELLIDLVSEYLKN